MGRVGFNAEILLGITQKDSCVPSFQIISGAGAPGGQGSFDDGAPLGSFYHEEGTVNVYKKIASANAPADWELLGGAQAPDQFFQEKCIRVVTSEVLTAGTRDLSANPFTDDEGVTVPASEYAVGEFLIGGQGTGSPVLYEVTGVSGNSITYVVATPALAAGNNFIAKNYLPDTPDGQELQALIHYNGNDIVKLGDVNWSFANGINLTAGYVAAVGNVMAGDTIEAAIAKLDGVNDAQDTLLGTAQGATDLGLLAGGIISDNATVKQALEELEAYLENLGDGVVTTGISTTPTEIASVLVDECRSAVWLVSAFDQANPDRSKSFIVHAINDGTSLADASSAQVDSTVFAKLMTNDDFDYTLDVDVDDTGVNQKMRLMASSASDTVTFTSKLIDCTPSGY